MKKIKTLLIDDEAGALAALRGMLSEYCPQIQIIGEASSIRQALQSMVEYEPELIFLDIEMPPFTGFDFINATRQYQFGVIFTTAFPEFAIDAIKAIQPWAYLVKPYSVNNLMEAVSIAAGKISGVGAVPVESSGYENRGIIIQDSRKGSIVLRVLDIMYCKSDGATLEIFSHRNGKTEKYIIYHTLKNFETQLPETLFCRVHHSYIVNLACVERFEITKQARIVYLNEGIEIPISIQKTEQFQQKIEAFLH